MKSFTIIFFFSLITANAYAYNHFPFLAFPLLEENQKQLSYQVGYDSTEFEYEQQDKVLTHNDAKYIRHEIEFSQNIWRDYTYSLMISGGQAGKVEKFYDASLNLNNEKIHFHGIQGYDLRLKKYLPFSNDKSKYAFQIGSKGSLQTPKETNMAYGGFDLHIAFLMAHKHREHYFLGELKSEIIGKKKRYLVDGGHKEITDAYSVFGAQLGYLFENPYIDVAISPYFYHTTDFNTRNNLYTRITDKGFIWGGEFKFLKKISNQFSVYLVHIRESYVFNVVDPQQTKGIDYEIERNETNLGLIWKF